MIYIEISTTDMNPYLLCSFYCSSCVVCDDHLHWTHLKSHFPCHLRMNLHCLSHLNRCYRHFRHDASWSVFSFHCEYKKDQNFIFNGKFQEFIQKNIFLVFVRDYKRVYFVFFFYFYF